MTPATFALQQHTKACLPSFIYNVCKQLDNPQEMPRVSRKQYDK
jgi:hypothetical protein